MDVNYFRTTFNFGWWARDRLFDAARRLDDATWRASNGFTYGSIGGILLHCQQAERTIRLRMMGQAISPPFGSEGLPALEDLYTSWREEEAELRAWLAGLNDADLQKTVAMRTGQTPLWQVMAHLTYHGMQHRSEAAEALTIAGSSPGNLDFVVYMAERK